MARRILAVLLAAMAVGQVLDVSGFVDALETYELGGRTAAWPLAVVLIAAEALTAVGLLAPRLDLRRHAAVLGFAVAAVWTLLGTQAFARGLVVPNCGCFGVYLTQPLRWVVLVQDAYFVALAALTLRGVRRQCQVAQSAPSAIPPAKATKGSTEAATTSGR